MSGRPCPVLRRRVPVALTAALVALGLLLGTTACTAATAPAAAAPAAAAPTAAPAPLRSEIGFAFDVVDLQTDHQFPGQRSTFHVSYQYRAALQGGGFDPAGGPVAADTYPYFQDVRDHLVDAVRRYPDKTDFYEVFLDALARDLVTTYPQLSSVDIRCDVPAYAGVPTARTATVRVTRP